MYEWVSFTRAMRMSFAILCALCVAKPQASAQDVAKKRPNVLFLFTDDQRADTIRALGNQTIITPNLDKLANSGFVFRNAYCMGSTVPAVCLPSRTMLMTGRSLFHLPQAKPESPNFPRSFGAAGYVTYHYGKRGNTPQKIQEEFHTSQYLKDQEDRTNGYPGRTIADDAVRFLREHKKEKPFCMYLAFANPHDERVVNAEYRGKYDEAKMPLPANYRPLHPFNNGELTVRDEALAPWPRTQDEVRKHLTDYYGVITYLDMQIGRILDALRETGEYDNTLIVYSSDHGLALGSHGLFGKQNLYEDGMKVPYIFAGPGIPRGSTDAYAYLYDIFPTLCDLSGVPVPEGLDGKSLAPVIRGQSPAVRDTVFLAYRTVQRAVRQGDWKLIRYPQINRSQLFNLKDDPHETKDLAGPGNTQRVLSMFSLLERQQKLFDDTQPLTSDKPLPAEIDESFFKDQPTKKKKKE